MKPSSARTGCWTAGGRCRRVAGDSVWAGRVDEALERADRLLNGGGPARIGAVHEPLVVRQRALGLLACGREDEARADLDRALASARAARMPFEVLLTLEAL